VSPVLRVRRGSFPLRYHRRRCAAERAVSPGRLDCCTGRARLEDREPLLGGEIRGCRVHGGVEEGVGEEVVSARRVAVGPSDFTLTMSWQACAHPGPMDARRVKALMARQAD
jgi:hypothetical protein